MHDEGFRFVLTVTPQVIFVGTEVRYDRFDFTSIARSADGLMVLTFQWGLSVGPPVPVIPNNVLEGILRNILALTPPEKLLLGYPVIAYDWPLPYIPGATVARSVSSEDAVLLAAQYGGVIQYNEIARSSYFFYTEYNGTLHIVWLEDARSIEATLAIVPDYGLQGVSVWTTMGFFNQLWLILNAQYTIERILNIDNK